MEPARSPYCSYYDSRHLESFVELDDVWMVLTETEAALSSITVQKVQLRGFAVCMHVLMHPNTDVY